MKALISMLPQWLKNIIKKIIALLKIVYHCKGDMFCPVCEKRLRNFIKDFRCSHCGSMERNRFIWIFLENHTDLFDGKTKKMLHIAPERCFVPQFMRRLGNGYLTADMLKLKAMVEMDITDIPYPDQSFDVIFCSHVLEHVVEDRKAIKEFHRVLKSDGWAALIVPVLAETTYEDASIVDPEERFKAFGQLDHVRIYGPDFIDRLRESGFKVKLFNVVDVVPEDKLEKFGVTLGCSGIYYCSK